MRLSRTVFLFSRFLAQNIKIKLEYKADFIIMLFSGSVLQLLGVMFLGVLYSRIPPIQGWTMWEIVLILASIFFTEGVVSFAFEGMWRIVRLINLGDMDRFLLRPVSPILQILTYDIGAHGIGNMITGVILCVIALSRTEILWTWDRILYLPVLIVSAAAIRTAISFAANCSGFWLTSFYNAFPLMVHQMADFAKYPTTLFTEPIQFFITVVLPYAFIGYIPAVYLFHKQPWGAAAWLAPLVAVWCVLIARAVFYRGLRRYDSPGN
ncbi:MAG: ABC-2 family transporter protein [Anaerolineales bacterium]|nr:ABC-2 family transporter protein [Anaerolineales bacterium]